MALTTDGSSDLRSLSKYFDSLVDLVPSQFYHDSPHEHLNLKYLKKSERAAVKRQFKEDYKKNKRAKLDPAQAQTSLSLQQQKAQLQEAQKAGAGEDASADEDEDEPSAAETDPPPQTGKAGRIMKLAADGQSLPSWVAQQCCHVAEVHVLELKCCCMQPFTLGPLIRLHDDCMYALCV